jgi:Domain of unknown function (DUF4470)
VFLTNIVVLGAQEGRRNLPLPTRFKLDALKEHKFCFTSFYGNVKAMLTPAIVDIISFFYPIGNTPAVCLTQDLACDEKANVLLLGCGDVRNILFTTYSDVAFSLSIWSEIAKKPLT